MKQKIQFNSDGFILAGNLFTPDSFDKNKSYPAILIGGSWTTVKEQMAGLYAERLAQHGFITFAIDARNFGESEGMPRFYEDPQSKIADYKNALSFLQTVEGVDTQQIFLAAICASSGYLATVAAEDPRVKAIAIIAAWLHESESVKAIYGGEEGVNRRIRQARVARKRFEETGETDYIVSISTTDKEAAMYGYYDYYLNPARGAVPQWSADKFAVMSWENWLTFDPMVVAKEITVPVLMVHSDGCVIPQNVRKFFNDIPHSDKIMHWTDGIQFDFYDQPKQVSEALAAIHSFFQSIVNRSTASSEMEQHCLLVDGVV